MPPLYAQSKMEHTMLNLEVPFGRKAGSERGYTALERLLSNYGTQTVNRNSIVTKEDIMKKLKRILSIVLALVLPLVLLSSCGERAASSGSPSSAPPKVVMYLITFNRIPDDYSKIPNTINQHIAKTYPNANVQLDLRLFGPADYANKIQLAQQSGTPMDIFIPLNLQSSIAQNQCADIKEHLDKYGQELIAILKKDFGDDAFNPVTQNGRIYGVPINKAVVLTPTFIFDNDMMTQTGYTTDDIKSIWDLDKVFAKIKKLYPNVYPYASINAIGSNGTSGLSYVIAGEQKMDTLGDALLGGVYTGVVFGDSGKVVNLYNTDVFRKYVNLMRDWYNKGYMPKDMATSTSGAVELATAGKLFSTFGSYADASGGPDVGKLWQALTNKNFDGKSIGTFYVDTTAASLSMCVSSTSKNQEATVKFLNILYTDPFVINTLLFGIENEDYVKVSEHVVKFPDGLDANTVPYTAYLCSGVVGSQSLQWVMAPQTEDSYKSILAAIAMTKTAERSPYFGFTFDATKVINEMTAITNVVRQYYPGLESGSLDPNSVLPKFNQALKDAGIDKVIAEKQKQLDAWMQNKKR